jgi:two-component system sensor histidine kinase CpxA
MLDLARLQQQDQAELLCEEDVVQERVQEWLDDAEIESNDHKLTLRFESDKAPILADWDWLLVERAFDNLVRNAIRFSPEGSELVIGCRLIKGRVELSVRDHGPGVPEDELSRIFDAFTQVDSARDHASGGYGIGLALVSRITELHDGTVVAENQSPGLKVTLSLPTFPKKSA